MEPLPPAEAAEIARFSRGLHGFGDFAPISQTVAALIEDAPSEGIARARFTAARQHKDYLVVLAHDLGAATVEALFVDVRSGYVYATAQASDGGQSMDDARDSDRVNRRTLALTPKWSDGYSPFVGRSPMIAASSGVKCAASTMIWSMCAPLWPLAGFRVVRTA